MSKNRLSIRAIECPPTNFSGYTFSEEKILDGVSRVNIFVGANHSGKSRLLRALASANTITLHYAQIDSPLLTLLTEAHTKIDSIFKTFGITGIGPDKAKKTPGGIKTLSTSFMQQDLLYFQSLLADAINPDASITIKSPNADIQSARRELKLAGKIAFQPLTDFLNKATFTNLKDRHYVPILRSLRILDSTRDIYAEITKQEYFAQTENSKHSTTPKIFTGQTLYSLIKRQLLGRPQERDTIRRYETFIRKTFLDNRSFYLIPGEDDNRLQVKLGGETQRPIAELGDGLQTVIIMTYLPFTISQPTLFFYEEPETYLHPGIQRKLLEFFSQNESHHFFLTTHSNHLLDITADYANISVFRCSSKAPLSDNESVDEKDPTFHVSRVSYGDRSPLNELGVLNSSVFLVNATIWVEGHTDRHHLRKMFAEFQQKHFENETIKRAFDEDIHFSFVEYGGSAITHWSFLGDKEDAPVEVDRLCARAFVVTDQDGEERKKDRKDRLENKLGDRYFCLPVREIENLLPSRMIWRLVKNYEDKQRATPLPDSPTFEQKDYAQTSLGTFINEHLNTNHGEIARKAKGGYAKDSGTLSDEDKSKLTTFVDEDLTFTDLSSDALLLMQRLYNFIAEQHGDPRVIW